MKKFNKVVNMAIQSICYELYLSPKPGLVDKNNSGAHNDMDYFTFIDSASCLWPYLMEFMEYGSYIEDISSKDCLKGLRMIGIEAEKAMFLETKGINTHKGAIFSMGIILCVIGYIENNEKQVTKEIISESIKKMCLHICDDFKNLNEIKNLTHGEKMYVKHHIKGIRGEAENGYSTIFENSLKYLEEQFIEHGKLASNKTKIYINTLLYIISILDDTNVLYRHNKSTLNQIKDDAAKALDLGGMFSKEGISYVEKLDKRYIEKNISPGGAADLLAVTIFLEKYLENSNQKMPLY
ncbi:MAG: triphosphoribosyl-dephospho-CoA synthase CitG [Acidaminobacteraceae bacterium]